MSLTTRLLVPLAVAALAVAGCSNGSDDAADTDARSVEVDMVDVAFEPETLAVAEGETIRFSFTNRGDAAHDAFVGDAEAQTDHEAEMRALDQGDSDEGHGGGHGGDDPAEEGVTVEPGDRAELTHTFDRAGTVEIGCHQPGHYDAGMKIDVSLTPA